MHRQLSVSAPDRVVPRDDQGGYGRGVLRVQLLGEFAVTRDGVPVPLPSAVARLTAFLALRLGPHQRDQLAAAFWPDSSEEAARSSLRTTVWGLRQVPRAEAVLATRSAVGLAPDMVTVDVEEVAELVRRGDLADAVQLCRGELLPDMTEDWTDQPRRAQHRRHGELLERLADAAAGAGDAQQRRTLVPDAVRSRPARRSRARPAAGAAGRRGRSLGRPRGGPRVRPAAAGRARPRARTRVACRGGRAAGIPRRVDSTVLRARGHGPCSGGPRSWPC